MSAGLVDILVAVMISKPYSYYTVHFTGVRCVPPDQAKMETNPDSTM